MDRCSSHSTSLRTRATNIRWVSATNRIAEKARGWVSSTQPQTSMKHTAPAAQDVHPCVAGAGRYLYLGSCPAAMRSCVVSPAGG